MKDKLHIRFLWLLVPFLAASCLYLFLYQYNNKYTRPRSSRPMVF